MNIFLFAHFQKRKMDAVYYYMRSLAASNPILTAKESLMSLFEEAKRKVGHTLNTVLSVMTFNRNHSRKRTVDN